MKAIKILVILFIVLFLGAGGALYIVPNYLDWNAYKPQVEAFLKSVTGYTVQLKGDMSIKTMPEASISLGGVVVKGFQGDENLLETGPIAAQLDLKNLLFMRVEFKRLSVEKPTVMLTRDDAGVANWEPKTKSTRQSAAPTDLGPIKALGDVVLSNINLTFADAQSKVTHKLENVQLSADGHNLSKVTYNLSGTLNTVPFKLNGWVGLSLLQDIPLEINAAVDDSNTLAARGFVIEPFGHAGLNFSQFDLVAPKPFELMQRLGLMATTPAIIVQGVDLKTKLQLEANKVELNQTQLMVNNTKIVGDMSYETGDKVNFIKAALKLNDFDMANFFPAREEEKKSDRMGPPWNDDLIDTSFFRRNNMRVDLEVGKLKGLMTPVLEDVQVKLNVENGVALLDTASFKVGKGEFRGNGRLDAGSPARYQFRGKYSMLPLEKFISGGKADYLELPLSGEMEFLFSGNNTQEIVESLGGKVSAQADAGLVKGVNLADPAIALTNFLTGKKVLDKQEKIASLSANLDITNGVIRNDDLSFDALNMTFKGKGKIDLVKWTIGYRLDPITKGDSLANIVLGVRVQGSLDSPLAVPIMDSKTTGAAIGTALGGPVGGGVGALIGSMLDGNKEQEKNQKPAQGQSGTVNLPFDFSDVNKLDENVRKFLSQGK